MPNGLEVIVVENHGVPLVTVEITVRNGSFTQTPEYAGLAHMYEHMFFKANDTYPNPDEFMDRGSEMGAVFNATTKEEQVNYYLTLSADSLEGGLKFLVAALLAPKFREDELERERQVVLGEYDRNESSPGFKLEQEMGKALWDGEWSRKNVIGDRTVIENVTPAQMRTIKDLYYVPNNSVLIISGDVNPATAFALADKIFAPWKRGADPFAEGADPADAAADEERGGDRRGAGERGHRADPVAGAERPKGRERDVRRRRVFRRAEQPAVALLAQARRQRALAGRGRELLHAEQRRADHGERTDDAGEAAPGAAAMLFELGQSVKPGYFSQEELDATKANRAVTSAFGEEKSSEFSHTIGFWWAVSGLDYYMKYVDEMAKRTPQDLRDYANKYIIGKPHVVGVLLSHDDRVRIKLTEDELAKIGGAP